MLTYFFLIEYTILLWLLRSRGVLGRRTFLVAAFVPAFFMLALRGQGVGEDTGMYLRMASAARAMSWPQLSNVFSSVIWNMDAWGYGPSVNVGYLALCKAVMTLFQNPQATLAVCAAISCFAMGRFIYQNEEDVGQAYWTFICGGLFMFGFNGVRQLLALSLAIQSYSCVRRSKTIPAALWIILGSIFHTSALVLFPLMGIYLLLRCEKLLKYILAVCLVLPFLLPLMQTIAAMISTQYASYFKVNYWTEGIGGGSIIWLIIFLSLVFLFAQSSNSQERRFIIVASALYLCLSVISLQVSIFNRVALYTQEFLMLLYPEVLRSIGTKNRWPYIILIDSLMLLLFFSYASEPSRSYFVFWQ